MTVIEEEMITLQPIAMIQPTASDIYAPSHLRPTIKVPENEFLKQYADSACAILVSFEPDAASCPQLTTAYAGPDGWYIKNKGDPNE